MKYLFLSAFLLHVVCVGSQTIDIEKHNLFKMSQQNEDTKGLVKKWTEVLKEVGGYPDIKYDVANNMLIYDTVVVCPNFNKKDILDRLKEFVSINYGKYSEVLDFCNDETGKLVVKSYFNSILIQNYGWFLFWKLDNTINVKVYNTVVFTVKDGAYKIELSHPTYVFTYGGYFSQNTYIPKTELTGPLEAYLPITAQEERSWKGYLILLIHLKQHMDSIPLKTKKYVMNKENDYKF